jgi:prefoldin subunit 5
MSYSEARIQAFESEVSNLRQENQRIRLKIDSLTRYIKQLELEEWDKFNINK